MSRNFWVGQFLGGGSDKILIGAFTRCSISNSEDSIVESRDVNTVNTKISSMSIDDQLKMIREEKHQEYLLNTGCKSPSSENTKNNKHTKQLSDPQD